MLKPILIFLYFLGLLLVLLGAYYLPNERLLLMGLGAVALSIPWIFCIVKIVSTPSDNKILWILFIFTMSTIAVPVYLFKYKKA